MELLEKFNCTISELFEKMGFNPKEQENDINNIAKELAADPKKLKTDIYGFKSEVSESFESYAQIISEAEKTGDTVNQKQGIKQMIWKGFKQFLIWASVCVVIPGVVCAVFPGTFIALLVPLACKLAWNGYKIYKLWKQWQEIRKNWDNYNKKQKWLTIIGIILSIIALAVNFDSLIGDSGKILSAFTKTGCNLLEKANLGIQPDVLTRGFAAGVKNVMEGKWPWEDFGKAFKGISDSFAEHIHIDEVTEKISYIGKNAQEIANELPSKPFDDSMKALNWLKEQGMDPSKLDSSGKYTVFLNGHSNASWFKAIQKTVGKLSHEDIVNGPLRKIFNKAGSIVQCEMTGEQIQKLIKSGIDLGYQNHFSIIGGSVSELTHTVSDVVNAATSMLVTIPMVEITPENGGFRIRLGDKESKNNIYEIGEKDIKVEKANTYKQYEEILKHTVGKNKQYIEQLEKALQEEKSDDKKQEIQKNIDKFKDEFNTIKNEDAYIFYGTKVEQLDAKESFKSLHDFLINEKLAALKSTTSKNEKDNDSSNKEIEKLFNGKELSDDDKKKVIELLKNKFKNLNDDEFEKLIKDIDKLADELNSNKEVKETLEYEPILILEGITNKNILNSLDNICKWFRNDLTTTISDKQAAVLDKESGINWKKIADKIGERTLKDAISKIFSKDKFKDPKLDKNFINDVSILLYKKYDINYDDAAELITSINKLYTVCSQQNKDIENADKDKNNDITNEQKLLYNHIIELLQKIEPLKKAFNNKDIDILKSIKIKSEDKEKDEFKNTVEKVKKELKQEKPTEDDKNKSVKDIINNVTNTDEKEDSSNDLFVLYKDIITLLLKNDKFKDDIKGDQKNLVKDPDIKVEGYISLTDKLLFEDEESLKDKIKKKFKQLKEYILGKPLNSYDDKDKENNKENKNSDSSSNDNNSSSDSSEKGKENDGKKIPVLMIANNYIVDLADANDSGPRKETFTLPFLYKNYELITIEGKLSKKNLITMFGKFIKNQTTRLYNFVLLKPCEKKKLSKKYKALNEPTGEREEFGNLSNDDITAILNDSKKAEEYVTGSTPNITEIIKSEEDKEILNKKKNEFKNNLENPDEETVKLVKEIDPNLVDKDGKIKDINTISDKLSSYYLAKYKADKYRNTKKSKGGLFSKIKNFVKGIFGGNKDDGKKYNNLLNHFKGLHESLNEYDNFLNECFERMTLSEYIKSKY